MTPTQILDLQCWTAPSQPEPVDGGITNRNYLVRDVGQAYMVRVCQDYDYLGIDRRNERVCQQAAAEAGVAPEVVHFEDGVLVSRYVDARTLCKETLRDPAVLQRLGVLLRRLHDARRELTGEMLYFCPFQTVRTYTATARRLGAELPNDIDALLADMRELAHGVGPFLPALCHNDLLAANVLDDGNRLWLVDWEYAGIGNPLFDLASVSANCDLSEDEQAALVASYGDLHPAAALPQLRVLKTVSLLREALWAVIQSVKSQIEFDYQAYATENLAAFRRAASSQSTL